jgi:hypothetical protein
VSPLDRVPLSLRMMVRGLVFLVRMWASERRFQRHARRLRHEDATARHIEGMASEMEFRARLCERRARRGPTRRSARTASGVPAVAVARCGLPPG